MLVEIYMVAIMIYSTLGVMYVKVRDCVVSPTMGHRAEIDSDLVRRKRMPILIGG